MKNVIPFLVARLPGIQSLPLVLLGICACSPGSTSTAESHAENDAVFTSIPNLAATDKVEKPLNVMYASVIDKLLDKLSRDDDTRAILDLKGNCKVCLIKNTNSKNWPDEFIQEQSGRLRCVDELSFFDDDHQNRTVGIRLDRYDANDKPVDPFYGNMRVSLFARGGEKPYKKVAAYLTVKKAQGHYDVVISTWGD